MLGRYSTGVRVFAAVLSGCGYLRYSRFVLYDVVGCLAYAALWVVVGRLFGDQVLAVLEWIGHRRAVVLVVPTAIAVIVVSRVWRPRADERARRSSTAPMAR